MRIPVFSILAAAAMMDFVRDPHSRALMQNILGVSPNQSLVGMVTASPVIARFEYWGGCLVVFLIISLLLASRKPGGPDVFGR